MSLPLVHPLLGTWPATQACALTGSRTTNPLVHRPPLSPLSHTSQVFFFFFNLNAFLKKKFYLFLDRGEGREKEQERKTSVWLPRAHPLLGTWPTTQPRILTGNRTSDSLVGRPAHNPLSHTSQGKSLLFLKLQFAYFSFLHFLIQIKSSKY